jgi:hypothetical protein
MRRARVGLEVVVVLALSAALAVAVKALLEKRELAISTVEDIESQLDALDPATRAAVVARLSKDAVDQVRSAH